MDQLSLLLAAVTGLATTAIIGAVKTVEQRIDAKIVGALGNLTPILVTALAFALPKLATVLHLVAVPDAQALVNAPLATIIAIAAREIMVKVLHQPNGGTV